MALAIKMSRSEDDKGRVERKVFERFSKLRVPPVLPGSWEKREPPEPDILCSVHGGEIIAYELTEACAPEFAAAETKALREGSAVAWGNDVSEVTLRKKLSKSYITEYPVELLLYASRTALPDDVIQAKIESILANGFGPFRCIWFLGDDLRKYES
jgi:hypothetical protein